LKVLLADSHPMCFLKDGVIQKPNLEAFSKDGVIHSLLKSSDVRRLIKKGEKGPGGVRMKGKDCNRKRKSRHIELVPPGPSFPSLEDQTTPDTPTRTRQRRNRQSIQRLEEVHGEGNWHIGIDNLLKTLPEEQLNEQIDVMLSTSKGQKLFAQKFQDAIHKFEKSKGNTLRTLVLAAVMFLGQSKQRHLRRLLSWTFDLDTGEYNHIEIYPGVNLPRLAEEKTVNILKKELDAQAKLSFVEVPEELKKISGYAVTLDCLMKEMIGFHTKNNYLSQQLFWVYGLRNHWIVTFNVDGAPNSSKSGMTTGMIRKGRGREDIIGGERWCLPNPHVITFPFLTSALIVILSAINFGRRVASPNYNYILAGSDEKEDSDGNMEIIKDLGKRMEKLEKEGLLVDNIIHTFEFIPTGDMEWARKYLNIHGCNQKFWNLYRLISKLDHKDRNKILFNKGVQWRTRKSLHPNQTNLNLKKSS